MPRKRTIVMATGVFMSVALFGMAALFALPALDRAFPPPLEEKPYSVEVLDRDGALLRAYAAADDSWRLPVRMEALDPRFVEMLIAYEDKRFHEHRGVDPLAMLRAAGQFLTNGRIVSGGSTITMQLARLMEPREGRSLWAKARQALRALQIERRLTKDEILARYLNLAPYGGNVEGVRAAALAWFGKEPHRFTIAEAAMLVALPQAPEARRPDRHPLAAEAARDRVLARMVSAGVMDEVEAARAMDVAVPTTGRREMPMLAAHAADDARRFDPEASIHRLTLRRSVQAGLESVARTAARRLGPNISVAMIMADARTGEVLGRVGSAGFFDAGRAGWIDMTRAVRSPGSTLKPFIYGLAFEEGLVAQQTLIEDSPASFAGYRPRNFDMGYMGDVSVREALQLSLNVPAVRLLDAVGPVRLAAGFRQTGARLVLPPGERPGLAIGLGGAGISLHDLVQLYTAFANQGFVTGLRERAGGTVARRLLEPSSAWQIADILAGVRAPPAAPRLALAYKTGTSYGYRDAWSVGFDGRRVLGIWVGRPDGGSVPGISGYETAAPILFEAFSMSGVAPVSFPPPPRGTSRLARGELPVTLHRYAARDAPFRSREVPEIAPQIVFPPDGARLAMSRPGGDLESSLMLKLQGGRAPFRWLANGRPLEERARRRDTHWTPDGLGYSRLTVIDAAGRAASVGVFVE